MNLMNNGQMDRGNENPFALMIEENPSQVGRHRDSNQGPPEYNNIVVLCISKTPDTIGIVS